jgi:hypothetical protein
LPVTGATFSDGRRLLACAPPRCSSFAADEHARANSKRGGHQIAMFVKGLNADAMPSTKFFDGVGIDVVRYWIKLRRFAAGHFRAGHCVLHDLCVEGMMLAWSAKSRGLKRAYFAKNDTLRLRLSLAG